MKILIAPDKFKGSLTAQEVCQAVTRGLLSVSHEFQTISAPMADGGEGTSELLAMLTGGKMIHAKVLDPLFREINASYGISGDSSTAFIEMAKASGLMLLHPNERNPLHTTSYGTGQLIADALAHGAEQIILCIGGSATNDAGLGMAEALGYEFFNREGKRLESTGASLNELSSIGSDHINPMILRARFLALCDVTNPLHGPQGAAHVYGPQKGADADAVILLDRGLQNFEQVAQHTFHTTINFPGAGAGGGIPAGGKAFLSMSVMKGMDYIIAQTRLEEKVKLADLVITGEGKIDKQTLSGKVVNEVAALGVKYNKIIFAVCGVCELSPHELEKMGISTVVSLVHGGTNPSEAMQRAGALLEQEVARTFGSRFPQA